MAKQLPLYFSYCSTYEDFIKTFGRSEVKKIE